MLECMEKYKNKFAIEFAKLMQENLVNWTKIQKENKRKIFTTDILMSMLWASALFLLLGVPLFIAIFRGGAMDLGAGNIVLSSVLLYGIVLWLFVFIIFYISAIFERNKNLQQIMKNQIYPKLLKIFTPKIYYQKGVISNDVYASTNLFDEKITKQERDDFFSGEYDGIEFKVNEVELISTRDRILEGYDRSKQEDVTLFKGVVLNFTLNKSISSHIHIYAKNSKKAPVGFEKVNLEYENFNKKYDVYVQKGGQIEVRYLLTTMFMERLMQLEMAFPVECIQCSIKDKEMLILLSTNKDLFEIGHILNNLNDITQYQNMFDEFASVLSFIDVLNLASKTGL